MLTDTEKQIIRLLADGEKAAKIAKKVGVLDSQLETSVVRLRRILGAKNSPNLIHICWKVGILKNENANS